MMHSSSSAEKTCSFIIITEYAYSWTGTLHVISCMWPTIQTMDGGSSLTAMVPAHLSVPLITSRWIGTETCRVSDVIPADYLWFGSDTYTICVLIYNLHLNVWLMGCAICIYMFEWWDGLWWPALSGRWLLSCAGCCPYFLNIKH